METQEIKSEIILWLQTVEDEQLLSLLKSIKDSANSTDWWGNLTASQQLSVMRSEQDHATGKTLTSQDFWAKHGKAL